MTTALLSRTGQITRKFSNGQLLLKVPQVEDAAVGSPRTSRDSWILRSAIVLSFLGFGFSAFSTQQLCSSNKPRTGMAFFKKS